MSSSSQPEKHLNADGFSAFVDNAMSENERLEVIAHIADCGLCQEVIVLLQEAVGTPEAVGPPIPVTHNWFSIHPFPGAATAALIAVLITSVAFMAKGHLGRRNETTTQTAASHLNAVNVPPPLPMVTPSDNLKTTTQPRSSSTSSTTHLNSIASIPPKPVTSLESETADAMDALHLNFPDDEADAFNSEAGDESPHGSQRWRPRTLPSKLPAIALVTRARYRLAADTASSLFISMDGGGHWRRIPKQWNGNIVRLATSSGPADGQNASTPVVPDQSGSANIPSARKSRFELTTDAGGVWISYDGTHWQAL